MPIKILNQVEQNLRNHSQELKRNFYNMVLSSIEYPLISGDKHANLYSIYVAIKLTILWKII